MDYPGEFNVPAFPAGTHIATSRVMGIGCLVTFLLIICTCGMILWANTYRTVNPVIIYVNPITGGWEYVVRTHDRKKEYPTDAMAQIAAINHFVHNWFYISPNMDENSAQWNACDRDMCQDNNSIMSGDTQCAIYCQTTDDVYQDFATNVMPDYRERALLGQHWALDSNTIQIVPAGEITPTSGTWRVTATIVSNIGDFEILGYAKVARDTGTDMILENRYPVNYVLTNGFYITKFDSYRIK
ncbi:MAG: hypothetical protein NC311_01060 [Muribaculaceae bacterium]|nr:hypothetical protein [Muribaculaceae bacterium]